MDSVDRDITVMFRDISKSKFVNVIKKNPKKTLAGIIGASLIGVTTLNDNVHFGSTVLNEPQGNHYVWGLFPEARIIGDVGVSNITTIGIGSKITLLNKNYSGNLNSYGGVGLLEVGKNIKFNGDVIVKNVFFGGFEVDTTAKISGNINYKCLVIGDSKNFLGFGTMNMVGLKEYSFPKGK